MCIHTYIENIISEYSEQSKCNSQCKYSELFTSLQFINLTVTATNNSVSLQRYHSEYNISQKQGRSDEGVYRYIYPPNQSTLNFLSGCFVSLQWLVNIYTHPNQIPGYASGQKLPQIAIYK